jgi:hypothetical protein
LIKVPFVTEEKHRSYSDLGKFPMFPFGRKDLIPMKFLWINMRYIKLYRNFKIKTIMRMDHMIHMETSYMFPFGRKDLISFEIPVFFMCCIKRLHWKFAEF